MEMGKEKLKCDTCPFVLTGGKASENDICPWCRKGKLVKLTKNYENNKTKN